MGIFKLHAPYSTAGDQTEAVRSLWQHHLNGEEKQILLGVTGSGKTFTVANIIAGADRPVLVLSHNKTLAAQLFSELKAFFPENAVEYFISYYDYYLPESYIPQTDTYIAKDAAINENIEKLRLSTTASLVERRDVIVVASVSCIYGLGSPDDYADMCVMLCRGDTPGRDEVLRRLVDIQYTRNDTAPEKGQFRVRGDVVDIFEPQRDDFIRVGFFGDEVETLERRNVTDGKVKSRPEKTTIFPCRHFVLPQERIDAAAASITEEMEAQVAKFESEGKLVEAQRLFQRVRYDLEMMHEIGYCSGIENYSMHLSNRSPGSRPYCLLDFFPHDFLTVIDESHVTIPQLQAMYKADRSRKSTLIEHGFRLPSALDNRPLKFDEFECLTGETVFVSATPGKYELEHDFPVTEQIVRPTGLLDPVVEVRPQSDQVDDVIAEIRTAAARGERVLVTTLTKKNAERLADYLTELDIRAAYLHSEMDALERVRVLSKLRQGEFDCLIGINLLREGIDLPEVALVAILDADKEGFLRSSSALVQTAGRAARNASGRVILYGDVMTEAMKSFISETQRRRKLQEKYNLEHGLTPQTIVKAPAPTVLEVLGSGGAQAGKNSAGRKNRALPDLGTTTFDADGVIDLAKLDMPEDELAALAGELEHEMFDAAMNLEFERAAELRDKLKLLPGGGKNKKR